ncbi:MAG: 16S rRNA (cytosine(1402)-N(4))-methyltransferase [Omnitrophica bacterium RIFCSPLOWO2_01_FULL_45_10]|nr:MAG: 16S rRNA (cytosine(1402)-N(4))-methyltransferase [Omnitrophica bacterium RIFCSPLOWO2_01_FULL_45_10]
MVKEAISSLNLKRGDTALDATIDGGGHAKEILKKILPDGKLIGLDADENILERAKETLKDFEGHFKLVNENFRDMDRVLLKEGSIKNLNAALFDLGLSSYQLENSARGFSIKESGPLDMRMDARINLTAYTIVNRFKERDLSDLIARYGEERYHSRIAKAIALERSKGPITTTKELAEVIRRAVGYRYSRQKIDPATRTFQAIRIIVNDELTALEEGLKKAVAWLASGARICVISFHSLEDRIVKNIFKGYFRLGILKIVTKKPLRPMREEVLSNPRSRSAKLRVAERL